MRFVSPVTLALALAITSGAVTAPAMAAKKDKEQAASGPKLNVTPEVIKPLQAAQVAMDKQDFATAKASIAEAEGLSKSPDDKYQVNAIKLNLSIASKDAALQGQAVVGMLDSGLVPAAQLGQFNAIAAEGDLAAKSYDSAITRAQAALQAGYKPEAVNVTLAQAYFGKAGTTNVSVEPGRTNTVNGLAALKAAADAMKAAGQAVPAQWYQIGVSRAAAAKLPEIGTWAKLAYDAQPSGENLRTLVRVMQSQNAAMTPRENLDLMRLLAASGGLVVAGDFTEYAEYASRTNAQGEAKSAIEAGRAKGVLNATQGADFYKVATDKIPEDKASLPQSEAGAGKAANGRLAAATADAYLGYGDYAKAITLFRLALSKGGVDADEVNTRLGIALVRSGDAAGAKTAFEAVQGGARKQIAGLWLSYLATKPA